MIFRLAYLGVMELWLSISAGRVPLRPVFGPDEDRNGPCARGDGATSEMLRPVFGPDEDRND